MSDDARTATHDIDADAMSRSPDGVEHIVLCDDLGWGDIEPEGGTTIHAPNINRMAAEGNALTDYYAPQNICAPSRAGLLIGRCAIRTGLAYSVILPNDERRLPLFRGDNPGGSQTGGLHQSAIWRMAPWSYGPYPGIDPPRTE